MTVDHDLTTRLRRTIDAAPLTSPLDPNAVTRSARARQHRRRTLGTSVGVLAAAGIVSLAIGFWDPAPPPAAPAAPPVSAPAPTPDDSQEGAIDPDALPETGEHVDVIDPETGEPYVVDGYEGWWNGTPADREGNVLPFEEWPEENQQHPRTATYNTRTGTLVETYDLVADAEIEDYVPELDPDWPADSVVIIDADTRELLYGFPVLENGSPDDSQPDLFGNVRQGGDGQGPE